MTTRFTLRLTAIALASLLLVGCDRLFGPTEADLSAFGEYVYRIDSVQLRDQYAQVLSADTGQDEVLTVIRQCYADVKENDRLTLWIDRMGVAARGTSSRSRPHSFPSGRDSPRPQCGAPLGI